MVSTLLARSAGRLRAVLCGLASSLAFSAGFAADDDVADRVTKHLAAGEFGAASDLASRETEPAVRADLLAKVAEAQRAAGEPDMAAATRRRAATQRGPARLGRQPASLPGGGAQVNYEPLMQMIREIVDRGQWADDTGSGEKQLFPAPPPETGVRVNAKGVLQRVTSVDMQKQLVALRQQARPADLSELFSESTDLRVISLTRLEQAAARHIAEGRPIPESVRHMGGLTAIRNIYADAATGEVMIAGPADGWKYDEYGVAVSNSTGRPMLQLDDFVVVLRSFLMGAKDFGCSINVRESGVQALQLFAKESQARGPLAPGSVRPWVDQLQRRLGRQDIVVWGVPADSNVARVLVEADYRMKLIGIDKLEAGKNIPSYFDLLPAAVQKSPPPVDALRWWLSLKCDSVLRSEAGDAFELVGSSVVCQSENQALTADGQHLPTGKAEEANRAFADNFTRHYAELARQDRVFAETENIFDLALAAAIIHEHRLHEKTGWNFGAFGLDGAYLPTSNPAPREVDSVANHRVYNGRDIVVQVAGGVRVDPRSTVAASQTSTRVRAMNAQSDLPAGRWHWDSK